MEKENTIFTYLEQIFFQFGVDIFLLSVLTLFFGDDARGMSSLFVFGSKGLSIVTIMQFFVLSVFIVIIKNFCFTDKFIKNMSMAFRTIIMFVLITSVMIIFIIVADVFPINMWQCWLMFGICFTACGTVGAVIGTVKERMENREMEKALKNLKEAEK